MQLGAAYVDSRTFSQVDDDATGVPKKPEVLGNAVVRTVRQEHSGEHTMHTAQLTLVTLRLCTVSRASFVI